MSLHAAVFLDRDGVINDPVLDPVDGRPESPLRAADVALAAGAVDGLRTLAATGLPLIVVSNQPAAAKGKATAADLRAVHERVVALLAAEGVAIGDWRYCFDHPEAIDPARRDCACRKPRPGLLRDAARDHGLDLARCWIVGDTDADVGAGRAVGAATILVEHPGTAHRRSPDVAGGADAVVTDLAAAATLIADRLATVS
ncbi:MAG TPA: HAD-IIIA family hydrolase [Baekduia sp.]|nr:HAD-IIIA family hydrolase [Baekduia sp.]